MGPYFLTCAIVGSSCNQWDLKLQGNSKHLKSPWRNHILLMHTTLCEEAHVQMYKRMKEGTYN